jgi:hypothetical protein
MRNNRNETRPLYPMKIQKIEISSFTQFNTQQNAIHEQIPEYPEALALWNLAIAEIEKAETFRDTNREKFSNLIRRGLAFKSAARAIDRASKLPI